MDTNLVTPLTGKDVDRCKVTFDYWLDAEALQQAAVSATSSSSSSRPGGQGVVLETTPAPAAAIEAALQSQFVRDSLASSHQVQVSGQRVLTCTFCVLGANGKERQVKEWKTLEVTPGRKPFFETACITRLGCLRPYRLRIAVDSTQHQPAM